MVTETINSSEMRLVETNAEYYGISLLQLMETAGRNVAEEIASRLAQKLGWSNEEKRKQIEGYKAKIEIIQHYLKSK